jgi:hypothetical protein
MSLQDDLKAAQRSLEELTRSVGRLENQVGSGLEIRRVRIDADHLRESLTLLCEAAPQLEHAHAAPLHPEMITIPDAPYDAALWAGADDEGLGASNRSTP